MDYPEKFVVSFAFQIFIFLSLFTMQEHGGLCDWRVSDS